MRLRHFAAAALALAVSGTAQAPIGGGLAALSQVRPNVESRMLSPENPTGPAASHIGVSGQCPSGRRHPRSIGGDFPERLSARLGRHWFSSLLLAAAAR
jgi:hypothetical protein